jgi:hypothetical protein
MDGVGVLWQPTPIRRAKTKSTRIASDLISGEINLRYFALAAFRNSQGGTGSESDHSPRRA